MRFTVVRSLALTGCLVLGICCAASTPLEGDEGKVSSLTIFPVTLRGAQQTNVAEVIGLLLEQKGLLKIKIAEAPFKPDAEADWERIETAFGAYVRKHPVGTGFAFYGEFQGSPKTGVAGIRGVLVDREGRVVWTDVQTPEDPEFKRMKPDCPMTCCVFLAERLKPMLALGEPPGDQGAMARLWAMKSALPEKKEFEAMEKAKAGLVKAGLKARVAVYPPRIAKKTDPQAAEHLAGLLNKEKLCRAEVAPDAPWFDIKGNSNEQRVLWDMARAFREHVRKQPLEAADYAMYCDYMVSPRDGRAMAVHFAVCDRKGNWVIVDFQNSHHEDFNAVKPKSIEDCNRLAARRLAGYLK